VAAERIFPFLHASGNQAQQELSHSSPIATRDPPGCRQSQVPSGFRNRCEVAAVAWLLAELDRPPVRPSDPPRAGADYVIGGPVPDGTFRVSRMFAAGANSSTIRSRPRPFDRPSRFEGCTPVTRRVRWGFGARHRVAIINRDPPPVHLESNAEHSSAGQRLSDCRSEVAGHRNCQIG